MKLKSFLLYSLLFIYSFLNALTVAVPSDSCILYNTVGGSVTSYKEASSNDCATILPSNTLFNNYPDGTLKLSSGTSTYIEWNSPIYVCSVPAYNLSSTGVQKTCELGFELNDLCECVVSAPACNPETEYLNENNECVLLTSGIPSDFPDNNTSNGTTSLGTVPTTQQGCAEMERYNSSLGVVEVIGWDYQTQTCKVVAFKCNSGRVFDQSTNKCIIPPDNTNFGDGNGCINDNWARKWTHDFCGDCVGQAGVWLPPLGHEESGMECNKAYIEYQCVKDYRIKKYVEVSCGDPLPVDDETNNINMDNLTPTELTDQNLSNLPTIDPTNANLSTVENLRAIESAIKDVLAPKIDIANGKLDDINSKLSISNVNLQNIATNTLNMEADLSNIRSVLNTSGDGIDPSDMDIDISGLDDTKDIMDNFADNMSDLTSGITSIQSDFENTKALLSGESPVIVIPSGSCSNEYLQKFSGYISPYSSIFSLVAYVGFMISIFKMIFAYMARGD